MMIGTILLIIWIVLKYGMDKIVFNGWWVFWTYLGEILFYIILVIIGSLLSD